MTNSIKDLFTIPVPRAGQTDEGWRSAVVEELRPYFITPRADAAAFLRLLDEELGVRELKTGDLEAPCLRHDAETIRKGAADRFWLVERNEGSRPFFEYEFRTGDFTSERYDDGNILIGYDPETDGFYSSSGFLESAMGWLRGIDEEDLERESPEPYPIRTAFSYAANLEAALGACSCLRGIAVIRRVLHARTLEVTGPDGARAALSRPEFMPVFHKLFASAIGFATGYPEAEDGGYRLGFWEKDGARFTLRSCPGRLYFGEGEYYDLGEAEPLLTGWLNGIM